MSCWPGWSLALGVIALAAQPGRGTSGPARLSLYIGTYTDGDSRGIYRLELDPDGPAFSEPRLVAEAVNPSFFAWHPSQPLLLAVSETDTFGAGRTGALMTYRLAEDGGLTLLAQKATAGAGACHVSLDDGGRHALVANYGAGSLAVLEVRADGTLGDAASVVHHTGAGPHPVRQTRSHAHSIRVAPGGRFVLAADLGADVLKIYRWDERAGQLTPHVPPSVAARPGAGPRHVASHPDGRTIFVINELDSTITSYAWDQVGGVLSALATVSTLPAEFRGENTTAEVAVHPSGGFVYGSNRGHDSIAAFRVQPNRTLVPVGVHPTGGRTPRHFAITPDGRFLLAANQESDSITLFRIDGATGALSGTGVQARVPSPVFVGIAPRQGSRSAR